MATSKIENLVNYCALSNDEEGHLNKESKIELTCKHHACMDCFMYWLEQNSIRCFICNEIETNVDSLIDKNKKALLKLTHLSFKNKLSLLNERENERQSKINIHCEFINGDVEIKIESLKNELELLKKYFEEELDKIGTEWKHYEIDKSLEEKYSNKLCQLELNTKNDFKRENLQQYYNEIKELEEAFNYYKRKTGDEPMYVDSKMSFNKNDIGKLVFKSKTDYEIMDKIQKEKYVGEDRYSLFPDLFIMPDGKILLTSRSKSKLFLYDENRNLLKTIKIEFKISKDHEDGYFDFTCCAYDGNKTLFFTGWNSCGIIKTDLEFKELARCNHYERNLWPKGICYFNDHIFVCNVITMHVEKFNSDLLFIQSYNLNFDYYSNCNLYLIKNIKNIGMISMRRNSNFFTCFYDLNNFNLIRIYEHECCFIGASQNKFYNYDQLKNLLSCYDANGELEKPIQMKPFGNFDHLFNLYNYKTEYILGSIACHNSNMIIGVQSHLCII